MLFKASRTRSSPRRARVVEHRAKPVRLRASIDSVHDEATSSDRTASGFKPTTVRNNANPKDTADYPVVSESAAELRTVADADQRIIRQRRIRPHELSRETLTMTDHSLPAQIDPAQPLESKVIAGGGFCTDRNFHREVPRRRRGGGCSICTRLD